MRLNRNTDIWGSAHELFAFLKDNPTQTTQWKLAKRLGWSYEKMARVLAYIRKHAIVLGFNVPHTTSHNDLNWYIASYPGMNHVHKMILNQNMSDVYDERIDPILNNQSISMKHFAAKEHRSKFNNDNEEQ